MHIYRTNRRWNNFRLDKVVKIIGSIKQFMEKHFNVIGQNLIQDEPFKWLITVWDFESSHHLITYLFFYQKDYSFTHHNSKLFPNIKLHTTMSCKAECYYQYIFLPSIVSTSRKKEERVLDNVAMTINRMGSCFQNFH